MRRLLRLVLLAVGCVVMVATSSVDPYTFGDPFLRVSLLPGTAQTYSLGAARRTDKDEPGPLLVPRIKVDVGPASTPTASGVRVIGILSERGLGPEEYGRVDPRGTFTAGQELEGVGTVAFVYEPSPSPRPTWVLPEARQYFLTLLVQGEPLDVVLSMDLEALSDACACVVDAGLRFHERHEYFPYGNKDQDGGTKDGG